MDNDVNTLNFSSASSDDINITISTKTLSNPTTKNFTCLYSNADSLRNKTHEIEAQISINNPDLILITEVNSKQRREEGDCDWSTCFYNYSCETDLSGRGVAMFIHNSCNYRRRCDLEIFKPSVVVEMLDEETKVLLSLIYRSSNTPKDGNRLLCRMVESL